MGRSRALLEVKGATFLSPSQTPPPPYLISPPNVVGSEDSNLKDSVSPSVLLIIIILAIVFFVSGLLHLLIRYLWRPQTRDPDDLDTTVLQGQLQQLFHLHDSGVDQSFIDTLPVFPYKAIIGLKNPFDCAVCLSEFEPEDKLRLLPKCSHAFHMDCIDTWLLSHSTCPICRACLLNDFSSSNGCSPIVLVLESGSDNNSREIAPETDEIGSRSTRLDSNPDSREVVTVKLGKIRNVDNNNGEGSSSIGDNADARRCFSMGSFSYVMDESSLLHVPIRAQIKKKHALRLTTGNRLAMSECDFESRRDFRFSGLDGNRVEEETADNSVSGVVTRKESFSVSKIWLREKKEKRNNVLEDSSRRAVSFRFPLQINEDDGDALKERNGKLESRSTISEMDITKWENGGGSSEFGYDDENQSCYSVDSQAIRAPSFARRTLLWLTGRQSRVVHSSSASGDL
ncbi:RING-H2 finger protein ATL13-like [Neltuma alba]|uniref:RING-H2 finger protein ATL13-like n=1 Tax=Neltuma alba TaxID=207710 RepID=UPI0010A31BCD|nr:RING-H2 finger protein ATL13-like [Prosopis alba]